MYVVINILNIVKIVVINKDKLYKAKGNCLNKIVRKILGVQSHRWLTGHIRNNRGKYLLKVPHKSIVALKAVKSISCY